MNHPTKPVQSIAAGLCATALVLVAACSTPVPRSEQDADTTIPGRADRQTSSNAAAPPPAPVRREIAKAPHPVMAESAVLASAGQGAPMSDVSNQLNPSTMGRTTYP